MASPSSASLELNSSGKSSVELLAELSPGLLATLGEDGRVLFANRTWRQVMGSDGSPLGMETVHPDDRDRVEDALGSLEPGQDACLESRVRTQDGAWRWVDWRIRRIGAQWHVAGQDVTDRHAAMSDRARNEARLAHAQQVVGVGSFEVEIATG